MKELLSQRAMVVVRRRPPLEARRGGSAHRGDSIALSSANSESLTSARGESRAPSIPFARRPPNYRAVVPQGVGGNGAGLGYQSSCALLSDLGQQPCGRIKLVKDGWSVKLETATHLIDEPYGAWAATIAERTHCSHSCFKGRTSEQVRLNLRFIYAMWVYRKQNTSTSTGSK